MPLLKVDRDSSVGIVTCYGLDGPGIESQWGQDFPHSSRLALEPTQLPIQWVPGLSQRLSGCGVALVTHPPSNAEVKERVELYLYSPLGLRSLSLRGTEECAHLFVVLCL